MMFIREFIHDNLTTTIIVFLVITIIFILIEWLVDSAKKPSTRLFVLFVSFSAFILYIFYNRLLRERLPKDLSVPVSNIQQYIYISIILINIVILIILLWGTYQDYLERTRVELETKIKLEKDNLWSIKKKRLYQYSEDISVSLTQSYLRLIYTHWQDEYHRFLIACFIRFRKLSLKVKLVFFYNILTIPKLIVVGCFLWDVLIKNELNLFYKVLWLLLIPLIFQFIRYNYLIIQSVAMRHIREELDNDPHAFQGSDDDFKNAIKNITEEDLEKASNQAQEFWEREDAAWYKRIFYSFREFMEDLKEKDGIDYYNYNLRMCFLLYDLPLTMDHLDVIKEKLKYSLNILIRLAYIIGWGVVLFKTYF